MKIMKNPKFFTILIIGLLLLMGVNITNFIAQKSNDSINKNNNADINIKSNDIIYEPFTVGTQSGPHDLDPTDSWDRASNDVIEQVVETLFTHNTTQFDIDQTMPRINLLASGYSWDVTNTILTVDIRTGITFHDGTTLDAAAVAWNFNRFMYLMNHTGALPSYERTVKVHSLYEFPDGTPVFQSVIATDTYEVTFTLNAPYAPILDAMCYISCGILSPTSTSATEIIDLSTGDIVGTGPFKYDYYITDTEVHLTAFDDYWRGKANFTEMVYKIMDDSTALNNAMLNGDFDFLLDVRTDFLQNFTDDPDITASESDVPGLTYMYLAFNTHQINITWRKAMSYAVNYTYIIEELLDGRAFKSYGCISPGYGNAFNHWLRDAPGPADNGSAVYDLTVARQAILDGLSGDPRIIGLTANNNPDDAAWEAADLTTFNYSYNVDNQFRTDLYVVLLDLFDDIGITLLDGGTDWMYFILRAYGYVPGGYDDLQVYFIGWGPDYLEPFNMIDPLFSNISLSNACQIHDPWVQGNLSLALEATDDVARNQIYHDIQWRLFAELYVHAPVYHNKIIYVYSVNVTNFPHNSLMKLNFYECNWAGGFTIVPSITIDAPFDNQGFADTAPIFNLTVNDYDSIWYTLDSGGTNTTCGTSGQIDPILWGGLSDAVYTLRFFANSSTGNLNTIAISIYKDTIDPVIIINDPDPGDDYLFTIPLYNISIMDLHFNSAWYTMDNGTTNIPIITPTGSVDGIAWNALPPGVVNITFYAIDDVGNLGSSYVIVNKLDPTPPTIVINSPTDTQVARLAPIFSLTIGAYDSIWYTLDNGATNVTCGISGQIDPTIWGGLSDSAYTLKFYANSSVGVIGTAEVLIYKDTTAPVINIIEPDSGDEYTTSIPVYEITPIDLHRDSVWYTVDNGLTNITITTFLGVINEDAWNALSYGPITITFYANDTVGNLGSSSVIVHKQAPVIPPGIPGPYPTLILTIIFAGIIFLTWRQRKKLI